MPAVLAPHLAHVGTAPRLPQDWPELARAWEFEPLVVLGLVTAAWLYRRGVRRWRRAAPTGGGVRRWEAACWWTGWATLVVALASPLHPWGQVLFAAHMTQHELLMVVAAPLLVLGRPEIAALFALPRVDARSVAEICHAPRWRRAWGILTDPLSASVLHGAAVWFWHVPMFFQATLRNEFVHDLQHVSFFGTALLFWWAVIRHGAAPRSAVAGVIYLFVTMMHTGLLGALILFAGRPLYPDYAVTAPAWGLSALEDQQVGGLIMWVPAGLAYVVAALALLAGWLRESGRRSRGRIAGAAGWRAVAPLCLLLLAGGCGRGEPTDQSAPDSFNPAEGRRTARVLGCGGCHEIPGVPGARGRVGPSLADFSRQQYIGGVLPNTPENLVDWLLQPGAHNPRTLMPAVVPDREDAEDIAAYLLTLRARD